MSRNEQKSLSLLVSNPQLSSEWDYEKNSPLTPKDVSAGSNKKVGWRCKNGHTWEAIICSRSNGNGCPICSGRKVLAGYNDLSTTHPAIAKEWDYERNGDLKPTDVTSGSAKKVWWICAHGHEWESKIYHRSKDHGCPYCSGRRAVSGKNDFESTYPELASEWNYSKNGDKNPSDFTKRSGQKVWWICHRGHEWEASMHNRTGGHGCPYCSGLKAIVGETDLVTLDPVFLKEWNYKKNNDISPSELTIGSGKKVWWICDKGHEWKATISDRARGNECPRCQYSGTSKPEQGIVYYLSQCCRVESRVSINKKEVDVYLPEYGIGVEYDGRYYHQNANTKEKNKDLEVSKAGVNLFHIKESNHNQLKDNTISFDTDYMGPNYVWALKSLFELIAKLTGNDDVRKIDIDINRDMIKIRELYALIQRENSLEMRFPEIAQEWNNEKNGILLPNMFFPGSVEKVWWKCSKGHEWQAVIYSRVEGTGCPYCSGRFAIRGQTDLETLYPEIAKEWNYEKNCRVSSGKKVWWKCSKGHEWQIAPRDRTRGSGCPVCAGKKVLEGYNDLATLSPDLAKEWNYERNGWRLPSEFTKRSGQRVWWKCAKGHEWESTIANRTGGCGCPYCSGKKVLPGYNDLSTVSPDLVKEWNYEKNIGTKPSEYTVGSGKKVWWKCSEGHEWEAIISNRTAHGKGCPYCAGLKTISGKNVMASLCPELVEEWDYEKNGNVKPSEIMAGSGKKVWWKCLVCEYEWEASPASRSRGTGCPRCAKNLQRKVLCVETGVIYSSLSEARRQTGARNISFCCQGKKKTSGGFHWNYYETKE